MTVTFASLIWCGAGSPVVQGFLTGLGILAVGLAFFPFGFTITRPADGRQGGFARASAAARRARWVAPAVLASTGVTLVGYVVVFVNAKGKFCDAGLTPGVRDLVDGWSVVAGATMVLLAVAAGLRARARKKV